MNKQLKGYKKAKVRGTKEASMMRTETPSTCRKLPRRRKGDSRNTVDRHTYTHTHTKHTTRNNIRNNTRTDTPAQTHAPTHTNT